METLLLLGILFGYVNLSAVLVAAWLKNATLSILINVLCFFLVIYKMDVFYVWSR